MFRGLRTLLFWLLLLAAFDVYFGDLGNGRRPSAWEAPAPPVVEVAPDAAPARIDPDLPDIIMKGDPPRDWGLGTGFAVADAVRGAPARDAFVTAAHVVEGCVQLAIDRNFPDGDHVPVRGVVRHRVADVALLLGEGAPPPLPLGDDAVLARGDPGFGFGFPAGVPAYVEGKLMGRTRARTERGYEWSPVMVWALVRREPASDLPLGGISGGPMLDARGRVVGVVIAAGSERRPRFVTTTVAPVVAVLRGAADTRPWTTRPDVGGGQPPPGAISPPPVPAVPIDARRAGERGRALRGEGTVVPVICRAAGADRRGRRATVDIASFSVLFMASLPNRGSEPPRSGSGVTLSRRAGTRASCCGWRRRRRARCGSRPS